MDRCALFVDAGYVLADGAMAVHGTRRRESVSWDYAGLLQFLAGLAASRSGLPLLRSYWYEATAEGRRGADHDALADLPGVKLRLAKMRPGRREGVESEIHRDLATLARNKAVSDAMVVSAEDDLATVIADVQDLGMRVTMLHITSDGNWTISRTLRQEVDDIVEISASDLRPFVDLISGAEPADLADQAGAAHAGPAEADAAQSGTAQAGTAQAGTGARDNGPWEMARPGANGHGLAAGPDRPAPDYANGPGLTAAGLVSSGLMGAGLGSGDSLLPVGLPGGNRPMPSFTPASAAGNGHSAPYSDLADYQRSGPQPSRHRADPNGRGDGPAGPAGAGDAGTRYEEPSAPPQPPQSPGRQSSGPLSLGAASSEAAPSGPVPPGSSPAAGHGSGLPSYGEAARVAPDPAPMYQAPPPAVAMPPLAMPGGSSGRQDYMMSPGSGGRPDLPSARHSLPSLPAPAAQPSAPLVPPAPVIPPPPPVPPVPPEGQPNPLAGMPQALQPLAGPQDPQRPRPDLPGPQDTPVGVGAPGQHRPSAGPASPVDLYAAPVAAGTAPAGASSASAAGGDRIYDLPPSRPYGSQDLSGYSPGAPREPMTREPDAQDAMPGAPTGAYPFRLGPAEQAYPGANVGGYRHGEPLPGPDGPGAQVHYLPPRGPEGAIPPGGPFAPFPGAGQPSAAQPSVPQPPVIQPPGGQPSAGQRQPAHDAPPPPSLSPARPAEHGPMAGPGGYGPGHPQYYSGPQPVPPGGLQFQPGGPQGPGMHGQPFPMGSPGPAQGSSGPGADPAAGGGPRPGAASIPPAQLPAPGQAGPGHPGPMQPGPMQPGPGQAGAAMPAPVPAAPMPGPAGPMSGGMGPAGGFPPGNGLPPSGGPAVPGLASVSGLPAVPGGPAPEGQAPAAQAAPGQPPVPGQAPAPSQAPGTGLAPTFTTAQPPPAISLADAVQNAHHEGQEFGGTVARDAPALWLEAVLARKPRMPSDLEARLLQGSSLPIDFLLHDEVRHALRRGFWDALERARR